HHPPPILTTISPSHSPHPFSSSMTPRPPTSTLFPYTTLFRSAVQCDCPHVQQQRRGPPTHSAPRSRMAPSCERLLCAVHRAVPIDRKSTRLNSSHVSISYAVFCLKKKK